MSRGLNLCQFIGNLTADPSVRSTASGLPVANASIAVNEFRKDKQGNQIDEVEFVDLVFWGSLAELAGNYMSKGKRVLVIGKLKTNEYQTREGEKRRKSEINVKEVIFLDGPKQDTRNVDGNRNSHYEKKSNGYAPNDDIPF